MGPVYTEDKKIIVVNFFMINPFFKRREAAIHWDGIGGYYFYTFTAEVFFLLVIGSGWILFFFRWLISSIIKAKRVSLSL